MRKMLLAGSFSIASLFSAVVFGAPGEYWDVTTKMDMPGMPIAMPPMTNKVCMAKGEEKKPHNSSKDKDCEVTDFKTSGNKSSWNFRCDRKGEVMTGSGEQVATADTFQTTTRLAGKRTNMTTNISGKRIGGTCDTGEKVDNSANVAFTRQSVHAQMCDTSKLGSTTEWMDFAGNILPKNAPCADKKNEFCSLLRRDAQNDAEVYRRLVDHDRQAKGMKGVVAPFSDACALNMATITRSICRKINGENYDRLSSDCPAEAKAWQEAKRRKECEGMMYTSEENLSACLKGEGLSYTSGKTVASGDAGAGNPAASVIEGAKKLKGLFRF